MRAVARLAWVMIFAAVSVGCAKKKLAASSRDASSPPVATPAPADSSGPAPASPAPTPAPSGPVTATTLEALGLARALTVVAPSHVVGLGVEVQGGEGMALANAPRVAEACRLRQGLNDPLFDLASLAAKVCALESVSRRLELDHRYASIPAIGGLGAYIRRGSGERWTFEICDGGLPLARIDVVRGGNGSASGALKLVQRNLSGMSGTYRRLSGSFDAGIAKPGVKALRMESRVKTSAIGLTALRAFDVSLSQEGTSRLSLSAGRLKAAAAIGAAGGALRLRDYDDDLTEGVQGSVLFDAEGRSLSQLPGITAPGVADLLPFVDPDSTGVDFGAADWACDGDTLDFSLTAAEFALYDACDAGLMESFAPSEDCDGGAYQEIDPGALTPFLCPDGDATGC